MILGKRPRPPIKRTTSMTEFTLDIDHIEGGTTTTTTNTNTTTTNNSQHPYDLNNPFNLNIPSPNGTLDHRLLGASVFPRNHRRNSADHMERPHFLTICHFCNRKLITGRDIFMYKGDSSFCSFECRQQQMTQDEKKDKQLSASKKHVDVPPEYCPNELKSD
uniref:FCS-Like Zinc finger 6-like n=1 Tax=Erigeron canadensis TaxID=72917 RepID=UPI001CB8DCB0|nr:FCS-Like Zinc finger 6-like [Erigeron canadensis]